MKVKWTILFLLFALISCNKEFENKCFEKQGEIITEQRILENFTSIHIESVFDIYLIQDTGCFVEVQSYENLMPYIETVVEKGNLHLYDNVNCKWSREFGRTKLNIHFRNLQFLKPIETCFIKSVDTIFSNNFDVYIRTEIADVELTLRSNRISFITSNTSSGNYYIKGICDFFNLRTFNGSVIYADSLEAYDAKVHHNSIGNAYLNVDHNIEVEILNKGNLILSDSVDSINYISQTGKGSVIIK